MKTQSRAVLKPKIKDKKSKTHIKNQKFEEQELKRFERLCFTYLVCLPAIACGFRRWQAGVFLALG